MPTWRLAKSLFQLREQLNETHPDRDRKSDGSIGDAAHSARASDHNPDSQGRVCAIDITHDPAHKVDGQELASQLIADPRMKYVIFAGKIFKARTGQWETYRGANGHFHHVHISVKAEYADDDRPWNLSASLTPARVTLRRGDKGQSVRLLQEKLSIPVDGNFGPATEAALKSFQTQQGLDADGIAGSRTWAALELK